MKNTYMVSSKQKSTTRCWILDAESEMEAITRVKGHIGDVILLGYGKRKAHSYTATIYTGTITEIK